MKKLNVSEKRRGEEERREWDGEERERKEVS